MWGSAAISNAIRVRYQISMKLHMLNGVKTWCIGILALISDKMRIFIDTYGSDQVRLKAMMLRRKSQTRILQTCRDASGEAMQSAT